MQIINTPSQPPAKAAHSDLKVAFHAAALLQRVDAQPQGIGAAQYQQLVQQMGELLDALPAGEPLQQLLARFPAAAVVYENRHYGHAGLCRSPLQQATHSELLARSVLAKMRGLND